MDYTTGKKLSVAQICDYLSDVGLCAREYINREVSDIKEKMRYLLDHSRIRGCDGDKNESR